MSDPLVSTAWLADRLGDADVQVIDATLFMPGDPRSGRSEYEAGHIPGALYFDIEALSDPATDLPHMLPAPQALANALGELGLRREAKVVAYDGQGFFSAPRAWWTLRVMGFEQAFVLDGGLPKWRSEDRPLETGPVTSSPTRLSVHYDPALVRDLGAVRGLLSDGSGQLVDARAAARFRGEVAEPRAGLRSGHMPGAHNLPFNDLVGADGTMKPPAEIRAAFEAAHVDLSAPIVTSCGSGVTAAVLALALARIGRPDVAIYDGSWTEWGGRNDTPVAVGA